MIQLITLHQLKLILTEIWLNKQQFTRYENLCWSFEVIDTAANQNFMLILMEWPCHIDSTMQSLNCIFNCMPGNVT
jgi:hypothetical protein